MVARFRKYRAFVQQYGWRACLFRVLYDMKRRHGLLKRRFPAWQWEERPLSVWLRAGVPADPAEYRAYREQVGPPPGVRGMPSITRLR